MPFKKKPYKRSRTRRRFKKKRYKRYIPRSLRADYSVRLSSPTTQIANGTLAPEKGALAFKLTDCFRYGNYINIFDQFRINMVVVKFMPVLTQFVTKAYEETKTPTDVNQIPRFVSALDRDDSSSPTDFLTVQEKAGSRLVLATKPVTWKFKPNRLIPVYRSSVTNGYKVDTATREFLDCGQADIPHYGLKYCLETATPAKTFVYDMSIDYYVSFKNKR